MNRTCAAAAFSLAVACGSAGPTVLAADESAPVALAAAPDGSALFWLDDSDTAGGATVRKLPLSGGGKPSTLATGFDNPKALVTDGATVFWLSGDGRLRSVPAAGGQSTTLATDPDGYQPFALALQGGVLYWLSTQPANPDQSGNPTGLATLASLTPGAGAARKQLAQMPAFPDAEHRNLLTTDGTAVYWAQSDGNVGSLDASSAPFFVARRQGQLAALAVSGGFAFWVQNVNNSNALVKKPLGSLEAGSLVAVVPSTAALVADGKTVYVASPTTAAVTRVSVADGSLTTLVSDQSGASALALGPGALFLVSNDAGGNGRVLKVGR